MNCRAEFESIDVFREYMESAEEREASDALNKVRDLARSFLRHGDRGLKAYNRLLEIAGAGETVFIRRFGYLPLPF